MNELIGTEEPRIEKEGGWERKRRGMRGRKGRERRNEREERRRREEE